MLNENKQIKKLERIKFVVDSFLKYQNISINQLSKIIKIPSSTIQSYLNNIECIQIIYKEDSKDVLKKIRTTLKENKAHSISKVLINESDLDYGIKKK